MRIAAIFACLALAFPATPALRAQDPGAQQDAEAAREKLLKAADQLDNIQANSEATKTSIDGMKAGVTQLQADVTKLQTDNAALRQQVTDLQSALDQYKAEQIKARQTLIDNVAAMIAAGQESKSVKKKKPVPAPTDTSDSTPPASPMVAYTPAPSSGPVKTPPPQPALTSLAPPPDSSQPVATTRSSASDDDNPPPAPPPKPQKGYYHIVATGETLALICAAYRENGVNVTMAAVRKANGLTEKSVLKPGQKIFIPKPGT